MKSLVSYQNIVADHHDQVPNKVVKATTTPSNLSVGHRYANIGKTFSLVGFYIFLMKVN